MDAAIALSGDCFALKPGVVSSTLCTLTIFELGDFQVANFARCGVLTLRTISEIAAAELAVSRAAQTIARLALQAFAFVTGGAARSLPTTITLSICKSESRFAA